MASSEPKESLLAALDELHREIDREASRLSQLHAGRLQCRLGCSACCLDDLTVTRIEAELIRSNHAELLENAEPHARGACAFLDMEGACRIYVDRPSVCRSQGLPLRMFFEDEDEEISEHRDICPLNLEAGPALGDLPEDECWLIGPVELEITTLDRRLTGDDESRLALRSLFAKS